MNVTYRMSGPVCGSCIHRHTTINGAAQCADQYERKCDAQGVYSDRRLVVFDGADSRRPTELECRAFDIAMEILKNERRQALPV